MGEFYLLYDCKMLLLFYTNSVSVFLLLFMLFLFLDGHNLSSLSKYIEGELGELTVQNQIISFSFYNQLLSLFYIIWSFSLLLMFFTLAHLFLPLGDLYFMVFQLGSWIHMGIIPIFLSPFVIGNYWYLLSNVPKLNMLSNHMNSLYYRDQFLLYCNYISLNFIFDCIVFFVCMSSIHCLVNWVYQVSYLGMRLWLVFILHSFCLSSISELYTTFLDKYLGLFLPFGMLGLSVMMGFGQMYYLFIQIYVYISFSLYFLFSCVLSMWSNDYVVSDNYNSDLMTKVDTMFYSYLVPVSLVEISSTHLYLIVVLFVGLIGLFSSVWMTKLKDMKMELQPSYQLMQQILNNKD